MKILFVVHQFLPRHRAGTELYAYYLAKTMVQRGHEVVLYFTEIDTQREQHSLRRGSYKGLPFFAAVHNRSFPSFRDTYIDEQMEELFDEVLDASRPDVVHFQHLFLHSVRYVERAKRRGLPVVYTLHEYLLMCLRMGQLLRPGLSLCEGPEDAACAQCARIFPEPDPAQLPPPRPNVWSRVSSLFRGATSSHGAHRAGADDTSGSYLAAAKLRRKEIQLQLDQVDLFVAPSRFLRQRFLAEGMIRSEKILYSDNGYPVELFQRAERSESSSLRVGFVGTIADYKGVHLLVEAVSELEGPAVRCQIYGDLDVAPEYKEQLLAMEAITAVELMGGFEHSKIAEILAGIDVLVVPSLWFENSPLTIHEAFLAQVPVLTADRGGMAELVTDGENGLHFRMGDAADLRGKIERLRDERGLLEQLRRGMPEVKSIAHDAEVMEGRYEGLLRGELPTV